MKTFAERTFKAVEDIQRGLDSRTIFALYLESLGEWIQFIDDEITDIEKKEFDPQRMKEFILWLKKELNENDA
jgi:hypothetical protein